jgi:serine/threonine protein phosphatase PrpC
MNLLKRRPRAEPAWPADYAFTHAGRVRSANEDAFVRRPEARLWAVADGMGGHTEGAIASAILAGCLEGAPMAGDLRSDRDSLAGAVEEANRRIFARAAAANARMGSTVVSLLLSDGHFHVAWVGDSRAYLMRSGRLAPLTLDHTQVQARVSQGLLSAAEARQHPLAHVLTRAVGADKSVELSETSGELRHGDRFLLCSDGVHGVLTDEEIGAALATGTPDHAGQTLAALCDACGAPDNLTLAIVDHRG